MVMPICDFVVKDLSVVLIQTPNTNGRNSFWLQTQPTNQVLFSNIKNKTKTKTENNNNKKTY